MFCGMLPLNGWPWAICSGVPLVKIDSFILFAASPYLETPLKVRLLPWALERMFGRAAALPLSELCTESGISWPILKLSEPELLPFDFRKFGKFTCRPWGFLLESKGVSFAAPPYALVVVLRLRLRLLLLTKAFPPRNEFKMWSIKLFEALFGVWILGVFDFWLPSWMMTIGWANLALAFSSSSLGFTLGVCRKELPEPLPKVPYLRMLVPISD